MKFAMRQVAAQVAACAHLLQPMPQHFCRIRAAKNSFDGQAAAGQD
jgi:hypothetical protein